MYVRSISTQFFFKISKVIIPLFVINVCFLCETFLSALKLAIINPFLKKPNLDLMSKYRPVSLPSTLYFKSYWKSIVSQIVNHLNQNMIEKFQSAYTP